MEVHVIHSATLTCPPNTGQGIMRILPEFGREELDARIAVFRSCLVLLESYILESDVAFSRHLDSVADLEYRLDLSVAGKASQATIAAMTTRRIRGGAGSRVGRQHPVGVR